MRCRKALRGIREGSVLRVLRKKGVFKVTLKIYDLQGREKGVLLRGC